MDAAVACQVVTAADYAGVREFYVQILVPQVGVGIKVDYVHIGVLTEYLAEGSKGYQMLSSYHEGDLTVGQNHGCSL